MQFIEYIQPELFILIPVMYLIGVALKKGAFKDKFIPVTLGGIAVALCLIYQFATVNLTNGKEYATAIFVAITQGILIAGASVYADQIIKQAQKKE